MTAEEYRDILQQIGWTHSMVAETLNITARLSRHWAAGTRPIAPDTAVWLGKLAALWAERAYLV